MNTTKLKELWEKVKSFFKNMSMKVRIILCAVAVIVVVALAALAVMLNNQPYATLFTNLSSAEASAILDYLQENGFTDYRLEGDTIYVRADAQDVLTAQLVMAGYPKEGYLYETYFENVGLTTTNSERNETKRIALQQRLEAIIRNFTHVRDAKVTIALGEEQIYVLQQVQSESTASVQVTLDSGYTLSNEQVTAIRLLVSHSVQNLNLDNVAVLDTNGGTYNADAMTDLGDSSQTKLALEEYYANQIGASVVKLLEPIYGAGNVYAEAFCTVDVNRRWLESEYFSQPEGSKDESGLIGTSTVLGIVSDEGVDVVGGIPGTTTNSDVDIPTYMEDLLQAGGEDNNAEWYEKYEAHINKTTEQIEVVAATLTDVRVAVTINANSDNGASVQEENLAIHVANGAGIGGDDPASRVSVLIAPFYEEPTTVDPIDLLISQNIIPFLILGGAVLLVILIMLIVILSVRRKRKEKKEAEQAAIDAQLNGLIGPDGEPLSEEGALPGEGGLPGEAAPVTGADIMEINTEKSMELRKTIRQFVQNNPEIAAQMVKNWLKGGDEDNG